MKALFCMQIVMKKLTALFQSEIHRLETCYTLSYKIAEKQY